MLKRTLSIILTVAMLCTLVPAYTLAEEVVVEETAVVENEETVVAEGIIEEDLEAVPMATFNTSNLVDADGVQQPVGIEMPETLSQVNVTKLIDTRNVSTPDSLPANSITYVLVDSDNPAYSNFTSDYTGTWINTGSAIENPWISNKANTRRGSGYDAISEHVATFVVPESVGEAGRKFQIVNMNIRTATEYAPSRYGLNGRGALVWIDYNANDGVDEYVPVATDITKGHDCIGNIQDHLLWISKGMVNWEVGPGSYFVWDWGPTVTLTPGTYKIKFQPAPGSNGGRVPGFIITDAVGYDWTKVVPIMNKSTDFTGQITNIGADFDGSFGAAGYLDFAGPKFSGEVTVDTVKTTATTLVVNVPTAADIATRPSTGAEVPSAYLNYGPVTYEAYVNDEKVEIVDRTVTVDGLLPATTCNIKVVAKDVLGNETELETTAATLGGEGLDYAFFGANASLNNVTAVSDAETKIALTWAAATPGTKVNPTPVVTYNVYVDGVLVANVAEPSYVIEGLATSTTYDIKVVTCTDGEEAAEGSLSSSLEANMSTAREPVITEAAGSTTATSTVLEVSSRMDPSAFTFAIKSVILNGTPINNATISGNRVTVPGLVAGAPNTIKVTTTETQIATGTAADIEYDIITVRTPAAGDFTLTENDCIAGSALPMPMCYDTLDPANWPTNSGNTNAGTSSFWSAQEVWYTTQGNAKTTISVPETDKYYAFTYAMPYDASRTFTASLNGTAIKGANGSNFAFAKNEAPGQLEYTICDAPVELTANTQYNVVLSGTAVIRVQFFAFLPESYAYDAAGNLLDPAGKSASILKFVKENFTSKEALLNHYDDPALLTDASLDIAPISETSVAVKWQPTKKALGQNITYGVYLDGEKVADVASNKLPQYIFENLTPGKQYVVKVDANGQYAQTKTFSASAVSSTTTPAVNTVVENLLYADGTPVTETDADGNVLPVQGEVDVISSVNVTLKNLKDTPKSVTVLVVTFGNNKMIKNAIQTITFGYGQTSQPITFAEIRTKLLEQNAELDPDFLNTKIFIIDSNTFVPCN